MPKNNIEIKILDHPANKKSPDEEVIKIGETNFIQPSKPDIVITEKDLEPEIKISQADISPEPPIVKVNRRDLARNQLELIGATAQDLIGKAKQFIESKGWWGKGKLAEKKRAAFEQSEQKRQSFEDLLEQIKILPVDLNKRLSDIEIANLEIKIINGKLKSIPYEPEIQIDISEDQIQELQRARQQAVESQRQQLQDVYANNRDFNTPILMERHFSQKYMGQEGIWSCAVASSLNVLHALGMASPTENEDAIIQAMGGKRIFSRDGGLPMGYVRKFMEDRGLLCRESGNIIELMQTLENGGVAILARQTESMDHAILVSGAETRNRQVYLRINDPLGRTEISRELAGGIINQLNLINSFANMYLIEDPRNLPEITILE